MKIEIQEKEKEFEPIELKITIESEEELCDLWHRFNINLKKVIDNPEYYSSLSLIHNKDSLDVDLWRVIDKLCNDFNLHSSEEK